MSFFLGFLVGIAVTSAVVIIWLRFEDDLDGY